MGDEVWDLIWLVTGSRGATPEVYDAAAALLAALGDGARDRIRDRARALETLTLAGLQREIAARWGSSEYGPAYLGRQDPQRDAHHALLHVTKASGKVAAALDYLDHATDVYEETKRGEDPSAYLADLVICAARIAETWPGARIDLGAAVAARLAAKFPAAKGGE